MRRAERATREFFATGAGTLARRLIGQRLVRVLEDGERVSGRIVETEAYLGAPDRASHAYNGRRTARTETMYARPGVAYVYFTYGMHHCMNIVCASEGVAEAVLLRALAPEEGVERMRAKRGGRDGPLCAGPGRLCQAMGIDRAHDGLDLAGGRGLFVERVRSRAYPARALVCCPRVGVSSAGEWAGRALRWYLRGDPNVSVRDRECEAAGLPRASPVKPRASNGRKRKT